MNTHITVHYTKNKTTKINNKVKKKLWNNMFHMRIQRLINNLSSPMHSHKNSKNGVKLAREQIADSFSKFSSPSEFEIFSPLNYDSIFQNI
jgi:hypothetical protein